MARKDVDAVVVVGLFERVMARAEADAGRRIEDVPTWQVARAILEVLGGEVREFLLGAKPAEAPAEAGASGASGAAGAASGPASGEPGDPGEPGDAPAA